MCGCVHVYVRVCAHAPVCVRVCVCMHVCEHVHVSVSMFVCVCDMHAYMIGTCMWPVCI